MMKTLEKESNSSSSQSTLSHPHVAKLNAGMTAMIATMSEMLLIDTFLGCS